MTDKNICRTCGKQESGTDLFVFLFGEEADKLDLRGKIIRHTPIKVTENDDLPKSICVECKNLIMTWHLFLENCVKADNNLKTLSVNVVVENKSCSSNFDCPSTSEIVTESESVNTLITDNNKRSLNSKKLQKGFYCIAKWCNNNNQTNRMFRIPKDKRCHVWLKRASREDLYNLSTKQLYNKYLCDIHFTDNMFNNSNKNSLRWNAMPTIFQAPPKGTGLSLSRKGISNIIPPSGRHLKPLIINEASSLMNSPSVNTQQKSLSESSGITTDSVQVPLLVRQDSSKFQHILVVNKNEFNEVLKVRTVNKAVVTSEEKVPKLVLNNGIVNSGPKFSLLKDRKNHGNIVKVIDYKVIQNGINVNDELGNNCKNKNSTGVVVSDLSNDSIRICDVLKPCYASNDGTNPIITGTTQNIITNSKLLNPCNIVVVDASETLKETDTDSLYTGQGFRECMYPCLACGEVFLMESSLAQHRKTYHDEIFDSS